MNDTNKDNEYDLKIIKLSYDLFYILAMTTTEFLNENNNEKIDDSIFLSICETVSIIYFRHNIINNLTFIKKSRKMNDFKNIAKEILSNIRISLDETLKSIEIELNISKEN